MATVKSLPGTRESPAAARAFIRDYLAGCQEAVVAFAELMISELVTNAVLHGTMPIQVEIGRVANVIKAAVVDAGGEPLVLRRPDASEVHGRGLMILRSLAQDWGVEERPNGKAVWFALSCSNEVKKLG